MVSRSYACVGLSRAVYYREPDDWVMRDAEMIDVLNGLAEEFPRSGYWKYMDVLAPTGVFAGITNGFTGCTAR